MVKTSDCGSDMRGFESHYPPHLKKAPSGAFFRNDKGFQGSNEILKTYYPIMGFELFKVVVYIQDNY